MKKSGTSKASVRERHERFVKAYIAKGENATEAYLEVKPHVTRATAGAEGHKLLKLPQIQKAIEKHRAELRARFALTTDRVVQELARVAYFNPKRLVNDKGKPLQLHELDDDTAAGVTIELDGDKVLRLRGVRPSEKNTSIEKAVKILRLYDKPPPPPPDVDGNQLPEDPRETARRMAFLLRRGAVAEEKSHAKAQRPAKKKLPLPA